jgi:hypothetical protein
VWCGVKLTGRFSAALLGVVALPLAGCGAAGSRPGPLPPLSAHLRIVADVARCDAGAHRFCGRELVVVATGGQAARLRVPAVHQAVGSAAAAERAAAPLMAAEQQALARAGWSGSGGPVAGEASASSPGARRWMSYGPASIDLAAISAGNLKRSPAVVAALRREVDRRAPALSMLVAPGTG